MQWLRTYLAPNSRPVITAAQSFYVSETSAAGAAVGTVQATDADGMSTLRSWQIVGGTGASTFAINGTTGQLTLVNAGLNATTNPSYTLNLTVSDGIDTSAVQSVVVNILSAAAANTRLVNISTRAFCSTGNNVTIGGFVIAGSAPKRVLIRAVGPSLKNLGVSLSEALLDPTIEVHRGSPVIAANDNWTEAPNAAEITSVGATVGAFPLDPTDTKSSALVVTLDPGVYSFVVSGKGSTSGIVLLEVYDADAGIPPSTFVNIASRAFSTTGNGVTIGGFVIAGNAPRQVLLRAVGPTLAKQGVAATELLADPVIELHSGATIPGSNDNWLDNPNVEAIRTTAVRIGASPFDTADTKSAALLLLLPPGAYSFIASGKGGTSGIVLVEVYDAN
ncbi:MAG: cadherin repeat domain-containing protein [Opitutus sp.]